MKTFGVLVLVLLGLVLFSGCTKPSKQPTPPEMPILKNADNSDRTLIKYYDDDSKVNCYRVYHSDQLFCIKMENK